MDYFAYTPGRNCENCENLNFCFFAQTACVVCPNVYWEVSRFSKYASKSPLEQDR